MERQFQKEEIKLLCFHVSNGAAKKETLWICTQMPLKGNKPIFLLLYIHIYMYLETLILKCPEKTVSWTITS